MQKKSQLTLLFLLLSFFSANLIAVEAPTDLAAKRAAQLKEIRKSITEISAQQLAAMLASKKDFVLLDVREADEHAIYISSPNSKHIPRGLIEWHAAKILDGDAEIVVYCRTGDRGAYATQQLQQLGYKNVVNLSGGIVGWLKANYPVETYIGALSSKTP